MFAQIKCQQHKNTKSNKMFAVGNLQAVTIGGSTPDSHLYEDEDRDG